ncbi:hypothetical protein EHEL_110870 [Encephalitozoon hellem ATCC 50504]|uniref:C2H2-type domain-containing protein n=1 Tax=Encephalitozoon hellem TaxID=27973 RepID=A0A9Q9C561_ENCHE|nr:uncharacterized protein EHEL_110870 [Encephalitozoon hellem ATCC 50504]AFM99361.1 hypothetical protein EHEL_110870 [Encephalitozoon hellem ATCC 50504]UTX44366.1 hypothetical protein GPU96_11g21680 [Encephalitozoon hellem]|eukprot:XP_003888342.1 hypothetical protein EHEL_110870 [Encephalitozoon hellem ATCC 50504]
MEDESPRAGEESVSRENLNVESNGREKEDACSRKVRSTDVPQVLVSQSCAARECAKDEIRKFVKVLVEVDTVGGRPLVFMMWASEEKPIHKRRQPTEVSRDTFGCESCEEVFDTFKKLQLHKALHKNVSGEINPLFCPVCNKTFDEKRKLMLHSRYHKITKDDK